MQSIACSGANSSVVQSWSGMYTVYAASKKLHTKESYHGTEVVVVVNVWYRTPLTLLHFYIVTLILYIWWQHKMWLVQFNHHYKFVSRIYPRRLHIIEHHKHEDAISVVCSLHSFRFISKCRTEWETIYNLKTYNQSAVWSLHRPWTFILEKNTKREHISLHKDTENRLCA